MSMPLVRGIVCPGLSINAAICVYNIRNIGCVYFVTGGFRLCIFCIAVEGDKECGNSFEK
jgi:hypothetical protein